MNTSPLSGRRAEGAASVLQMLQQRGLSERSARLYQSELMRIEQAVKADGYTLKSVPADALAEYVRSRPKTWSTRKLIRSSLVHYWEIVGRRNPPLWVLRTPRKPRMRCRALEPEDAKLLAKAARQRGDRKGLAVLFALYAGLRREEISQVRWEDVTHDGWLRIFGKGDQPAQLPLHPALIHALGNIERTSKWVFPGQHKGQPVCPTTIWTWVVAVAAEVGLQDVAPHRLRHTCLATANDNTGDLRAVQELARHARPETTAGYTRATTTRLKAAVGSLDY